METADYPRVAAYIAGLPAGLDSYPTCVQKGSLSRIWIAAAPPLKRAASLPPPIRKLIETPPLHSSWVPEVHANAIYLAICDEHFSKDEDFIGFCSRTNDDLFKTPGYRALAAITSPSSFLHALRLGWRFLRKGTSIAMAPIEPTGMRVRLTWPPDVTPEVLARCFGTAFRAGLEASKAASTVSVAMASYTRDSAAYDVSWE